MAGAWLWRQTQQREGCSNGQGKGDEAGAGAGTVDTIAETDGIITKDSRKGSSDWPSWSCDCHPTMPEDGIM